MKTWMMTGMAFVCLWASPAQAQLGGNLMIEPYAAYGFFGGLPVENIELDHSFSFGGRVGYRFAEQWAAFGNFQRSNTGIVNAAMQQDLKVDHWSAGIEFSYVPRGGAEGMLPVLLEAGLGQARYEDGPSDLAINLGAASAIQMTNTIRFRYGVNDYISNYDGGEGIVNQVFARVGLEISL